MTGNIYLTDTMKGCFQIDGYVLALQDNNEEMA